MIFKDCPVLTEEKNTSSMYERMRFFAKICTDKRFVKITSSLVCIGYTLAAWKYPQKVSTLKYHTWLDTLKSPYEVRCQGTAGKKLIDPPENEIRIILVGATDHAINKIASALPKDVKCKTCFPKQTQFSTLEIHIDSKKYMVDVINTTPVVEYSKIPDEQKIYEIYKAIALSSPGPHVFLLCIPAATIDEKCCNAIRHFENLFGYDMYDYVIVAFTHYDKYEASSINESSKRKQFNEKLNHAIETNKVLMKIKTLKTDYIVVDSNVKIEETVKQVIDIFHERERMNESKEGQFATCVLSEFAEKEIQKRINDKESESDRKKLRDKVKKSEEFIKLFSNRPCA